MSRTWIICVAFSCLAGCTDPNDKAPGPAEAAKAPRFLRDDQMKCATFAEAVNHYVDMGEAKAIAALKALAASKPQDHIPDRAQTRMAFVCRVLFEPKGKEPLRQPLFGGLMDLPSNTMPLERWPLYPVVRAGSSFFVLSEAYILAGVPELPNDYLDYCCREGQLRKERVPIPTRAQARRDLRSLRDSEVWKALKWKDRGQGFEYELSEQGVLEYLKAQAD